MAYIGIVSSTDTEQLSPNYIGFQPTVQRPESAFVVDTFTGNGVQTVFPLSNPKPVTSRALLVSVDGTLLVPVNDYNLDSTGNIEFVTAPGAGTYVTVHHLIFPKNEATTTIRKLDDISSQFDGTTTQFTLTANGVAADIIGQNVLIISIDGVIQEPGIAYTMSGDDIIFSEAPQAISSFYGVDIGTTGIGTPSDATVSTEKLLTSNNGSSGQVLSIDSNGNLVWTTLSGNVGALNLDGLSDVAVASPLAGHTLVYNGSEFVNTALSYADLANKPSLSTVATSGQYSDLIGSPTIPTDIDDLADGNNLLFSGSYNDLTDKPSIPSTADDLADIDIQTPAANQVLVYDGANWINDNLELTDLVGIVDGTNGQVLTTDGNGSFSFQTAPTTTIGSWTLSPGANTVSFTVDWNRTYTMWVRGNIPNGIVVWNATVTVTNANVPIIGTQYAWYYVDGGNLVLTSIPNQIIGTAGSIITGGPAVGTTSNTFVFGITNNSGSNCTVEYGYIKL